MAIRDLAGPGAVRRATPGERVAAGLVSAGLLALLAVSASLEPSPEGMGTHVQLSGGMTPCVWLRFFGWPCATCGMTTAFAHAADGSFLRSLATQPLGGLLAIGSSAMVWLAGHVAATGSRLSSLAGPRVVSRVVAAGVWLLVLSWGYTLARHGGWWN
jgi:hypothetical protein